MIPFQASERYSENDFIETERALFRVDENPRVVFESRLILNSDYFRAQVNLGAIQSTFSYTKEDSLVVIGIDERG